MNIRRTTLQGRLLFIVANLPPIGVNRRNHETGKNNSFMIIALNYIIHRNSEYIKTFFLTSGKSHDLPPTDMII